MRPGDRDRGARMKTKLLPRVLVFVLAIALGAAACPAGAVPTMPTVARVSVSSAGAEANRQSYWPAVSSTGRYVTFASDSWTLVAGDTNNTADVFLRDRLSGTTTRVSRSASGAQSNGLSDSSDVSADGRYVAFRSDATNLVAGDTNANGDIFVRDRTAGTTTRVSVGSAGVQGNSGSGQPSISADGRYVAFESDATNLVANDTNGVRDVFVRDRVAGTTSRMSLTYAAQGDASSISPAISADGRYVAFTSNATNLVSQATRTGTRTSSSATGSI